MHTAPWLVLLALPLLPACARPPESPAEYRAAQDPLPADARAATHWGTDADAVKRTDALKRSAAHDLGCPVASLVTRDLSVDYADLVSADGCGRHAVYVWETFYAGSTTVNRLTLIGRREDHPAVAARPRAAPGPRHWNGHAPLVCEGNERVVAHDITATFKGTAIDASGNCRVVCTSCNLTAPLGVDVSGNARVVFEGGSLETTKAVDASGNARVDFHTTKVVGEVTTTGNARVR